MTVIKVRGTKEIKEEKNGKQKRRRKCDKSWERMTKALNCVSLLTFMQSLVC